MINRFDPPCTWLLCRMDKETMKPKEDGLLSVRFVPINKNHTRALLRNYGFGFTKFKKYIPMFKDVLNLVNWRVCNLWNVPFVSNSIFYFQLVF